MIRDPWPKLNVQLRVLLLHQSVENTSIKIQIRGPTFQFSHTVAINVGALNTFVLFTVCHIVLKVSRHQSVIINFPFRNCLAANFCGSVFWILMTPSPWNVNLILLSLLLSQSLKPKLTFARLHIGAEYCAAIGWTIWTGDTALLFVSSLPLSIESAECCLF